MMVNRAKCYECEYSIDYLTHGGQKPHCPECGEQTEFAGKVGCVRGLNEGQVPVGLLREKAGEWREFAEPPGWDGYSSGIREATKACADELEELLDDVEGNNE